MFEKIAPILLPIFLIMGLGYICGKIRLLGDNSATILNRFVTHISLPLLLFGTLANQPLSQIFNLPFVIAFGGAAIIAFILPWIRPRGGPGVSGLAMRSLGASFSNASFVGLPLLTPVVGTLALAAVGVSNIILLTLMAVTILILELQRGDRTNRIAALRIATLHMFKNPIVFGMCAGLAYSLTGLSLPGWIERTTQIVGAATPPVALFAMGEALVAARLSGFREIGLLAGVKLIVMPLATIGILMLFPQVDHKWAVAAVLTAALGTAVLDYIIASEYREGSDEASSLVLTTTILSALTIPVFFIVSLHIWPL